MRELLPRHGDTRIVVRFLLSPLVLPVRARNPYDFFGEQPVERRWLEIAKIVQVFRSTGPISGKWVDTHWASD